MASESQSSSLSPAISMASPLEAPLAPEEVAPKPRIRRYRARLSSAEKIKKASDFLRTELNLTPAEYIKLLFSQTDAGNRVRQKHFFEAAYTSPEILQYLEAHPTTRVEVLKALEWGIPDLRKEMVGLTESELFGGYHASDKNITSISLYLHSKGVKRVVIELLHQFGVTISYDTIMKNVRTLSKDSADEVVSAGQASNAVTVYDNFEQTEGVREQRIEDNSSFNSVTTGKVFEGLEIPSGGLRQDMLNPQAQLSIQQVLFAPGNHDDEVRQQVSCLKHYGLGLTFCQ
ncbi:hypothetical protein FGG08_005052 [Glutinoglossum americanum]|uniref:Uncharacterized protein n=1 Tax=Glutinoglossum americanum TaxID=1670608 RepID=A0A9P8I3T8_9PEZI|nr:hypothetical protein FGG08_005052 [Glutinoglossum americanum]